MTTLAKARWKITTGILALCLIASLGAEAAGLNPFTALSSKATQSTSSSSGLIPLTVAISGAGSPSTSQPGFGVALGLGAFAVQGLDVKWVSLQPATNLLIAALLTDQVQIMSSGVSPFFVAAQKDVTVTYIYNTGNFGGTSALFARPGLKDTVKTPYDLKGKSGLRCGSGSPGTTTFASLQLIQKFYGFTCESTVNVASEAVAVGSLSSGSLDLVGNTLQWARDAEQQGLAYTLVDPSDPAAYAQLYGTAQIPWTGFLATSGYVQANPTIIQKFVNAMLVADMFMSSHTPDQIATVIRRVPGTTDTPDQIKTALDSLAPFNPKTPDVSAQDWVATLAFANGFLSMDTSSPGFGYGTFWNSQFIEQSPYFVP
jgi:ABC-type nitrate/sulfonate/bicarbonate transport system substrate-binding protein